jgi:cytoskeletal protein CcmA (bactofilin family)
LLWRQCRAFLQSRSQELYKRMMPNETATVIGRSMKVRGEFSGTDDLMVDGEIDGVIRLSASRLTVRAEGVVRAMVLAQDVVVLGRIEGEIRATGRVELRSGAVVVGDVFAGRLSMEDGAVLRGHVDPARATEALPHTADGASVEVAP